MIQMNGNDVGLFRWDGGGAFRDAASCDEPGNRQLGADDGNHGIEGDGGRLVHGEILGHLRAVGARVSFLRVCGIAIQFADVSLIHGNLRRKTNGHLIELRVEE